MYLCSNSYFLMQRKLAENPPSITGKQSNLGDGTLRGWWYLPLCQHSILVAYQQNTRVRLPRLVMAMQMQRYKGVVTSTTDYQEACRS